MKRKKLLSSDSEIGTKNKRKALMDVILEHHLQTKDLTEEDIREEVDTFAFEVILLILSRHNVCGHKLGFLYLIGLHKNVQEKIHEELDGIFGDDVERPADTKDLQDMHYLECVLKVRSYHMN
ncbi:cytochrome P450 4c3 [Caerostris extrusa]|uniref:Cytochrome P450 4c3 n=1 Tax=Caerostris extrusa TaxID=172846 RepID=A0AAV4W185_CAEEX|nr:cytochrome P450 4c3 [Caerostris extrusa]